MKESALSPQTLLASARLKVTPARVAVIEAFGRAHEPLAIQDILKKIRGRDVNQATVYRVIEALEAAGIVRRVDFHHDHAHYELMDEKDHHHVICESCGAVEDVVIHDDELLKSALRRSKTFRTVAHHSLEFYGLCQRCARAAR